MKTKLTNPDYEIKIGKQTLKLTNQNKIYFPDDNITKSDIVDYYFEIAPIILPYLKDRPQSLNRFPNGIKAPSFFQKDLNRDVIPEWVHTEKVHSDSNKEYLNYLICNDKETLVYMANLGCIEINPWNSKLKDLDKPDWLVIDLDPEDIPFTEVIKTALETKNVFDEMDINSYCKTSGGRGMHIFVPLAAKYEYDVVRNFANLIAKKVNERLPEITSLIRQPAKRKKKVYLDYLQNSRGQTLASPYSIRPRKFGTVSTPLDWKEVNSKLHPTNFTVKNTLKRLDKKGDLWKPVIGKGTDLKKVLKNI